MINESEPVFAASDVTRTIAFYRDVLGGRNDWLWGDDASFGGITLGQKQVLFCKQPDLAGNIDGLQHFFRCEKIDELHEEHLAAGAPIISPIENKPWGVREYTVRDPNGYHLRFSGPPRFEKSEAAADVLADHYTIELRIATWDEYEALHCAVGWGEPGLPRELLRMNVSGAVAVDSRTGQAVGMVRVMRDADTWFSMWDVMVHPDHQQQRIGGTMVAAVIDDLRTRFPKGGSVSLFTYHPGFYANLGFHDAMCTQIKL